MIIPMVVYDHRLGTFNVRVLEVKKLEEVDFVGEGVQRDIRWRNGVLFKDSTKRKLCAHTNP